MLRVAERADSASREAQILEPRREIALPAREQQRSALASPELLAVLPLCRHVIWRLEIL